MPNHVEMSTQAERDVRRLDRTLQRRLQQTIEALYEQPLPPNLNIVPMTDRPPWKRIKTAKDYRVIYRPLDDAEIEEIDRQGCLKGRRGYLVGRVVHRSDLVEAGRKLGVTPPKIRLPAS